MRFYNVILSITFLALTISGLIYSAFGQQYKGQIVVEPETKVVSVCTTFPIDIAVRNLDQPINGFLIIVTWDAKLMRYVSHQNHIVSLPDWGFMETEKVGEVGGRGYYLVHMINDGENLIQEGATIATLTFHCEGEGSSKIELPESFSPTPDGMAYSSYLYSAGGPLDTEVIEGTVNQVRTRQIPVGGQTFHKSRIELLSPWIGLFGLIGMAFVVLVLKRRRP